MDDSPITVDAGPPASPDGGSSSPVGDAPSVDREAYCESLARAQCRAHQACCSFETALYSSEEVCVEERVSRCLRVLEGQGWEDGRLSFDGRAAAAVVDAIDMASQGCAPHGRDPYRETIRGEAPEDTACTVDLSSRDLSPSLVCGAGLACHTRLVEGSVQGTCRPAAVEGAPCREQACSAGLFCDAEKVCTQKGGDGDPCRRTADCASGHFCREGACEGPTLCLRVPG